MSDELTAAKTSAEIAKIQAETRMLEINALRADAELEKLQNEARAARIESDLAELKSKQAVEDDQMLRALDSYNQVYRFDGAVDKMSVKQCINSLSAWSRMHPGADLEVIFSSPGGSILDGLGLYDFLLTLKGRNHRIVTGVLGHAASMAGILVQAGDYRWAGPESWYLIHRASFGSMGSTYEVADTVKWIERIEQRFIGIFTSRTNLSAEYIRENWERKDWWLDADELLEHGIVDEIRGLPATT